jgi:hypothetical protein
MCWQGSIYSWHMWATLLWQLNFSTLGHYSMHWFGVEHVPSKEGVLACLFLQVCSPSISIISYFRAFLFLGVLFIN